MNEIISPKYQMKLVKSVHDAIWEEYKSYKEVSLYISKWYEGDQWNNNWENFHIYQKDNGEIDLLSTLHSMIGSDILKIAIDMGVETPDFIPSIPTFKNELKSDFKIAYDTFTRAFKQIEIDPGLAIGLANSALESIIKEILKDERISSKVKGTETLYKLTTIVLKEFNILDDNHPVELKTIGSALLSINQSIEKLRSEKTNFHGKTSDDYLINDTVFTYFVINSVATVGLFLNSYFKTKFPKPIEIKEETDDLPF
ncbi:abortive infection family protein [Flavobacterium sp. F-65]|uniref:Abortive infection family protein n=1 Tax=Flavobacterium pisciphilum TaxID=2893755 RepID=A0ABS8MWW5_9FLAO|nr:abortive infection family protein [Flavobacterium sp. F-65]MCC9073272.1 abortive infection family protein [Flavobacterium sp. F-65]